MELTDIEAGKTYSISNYDGLAGAPDYMTQAVHNTGAVAYGTMGEVSAREYARIATHSAYIVCGSDGRYYTTRDNISWWMQYVDDMRAAADSEDGIGGYGI